ncbi:hypothetical protein L9G16_23475, partial [Shewanella sp. A25]|nr:hypothetical protein [Shewanella shenzhenensis]
EQLQEHQEGLLIYLEEHKELIPEIAKLVLSVGADLLEARKASNKDGDSSNSEACDEILSWLQWLMFINEPHAMLDDLER